MRNNVPICGSTANGNKPGSENQGGVMRTYCTQNNGLCGECSLSNYGRDCQNNEIGDGLEAPSSFAEELASALRGAKDAIERIEKHSGVILENPAAHKRMLDALLALSYRRHDPII